MNLLFVLLYFFSLTFPLPQLCFCPLPLPCILPPLCAPQSLSSSSFLPDISLCFTLPLPDVIATAVEDLGLAWQRASFCQKWRRRPDRWADERRWSKGKEVTDKNQTPPTSLWHAGWLHSSGCLTSKLWARATLGCSIFMLWVTLAWCSKLSVWAMQEGYKHSGVILMCQRAEAEGKGVRWRETGGRVCNIFYGKGH